MSSSSSRCDDDLDPEYELALRIALELSKLETGGQLRIGILAASHPAQLGRQRWPLPARA